MHLPYSTVHLISFLFSLSMQLGSSQSRRSKRENSQRNFGAQRSIPIMPGSKARMVSVMLVGRNYWMHAETWAIAMMTGWKLICQFWTTTAGLYLIFAARRNLTLDSIWFLNKVEYNNIYSYFYSFLSLFVTFLLLLLLKDPKMLCTFLRWTPGFFALLLSRFFGLFTLAQPQKSVLWNYWWILTASVHILSLKVAPLSALVVRLLNRKSVRASRSSSVQWAWAAMRRECVNWSVHVEAREGNLNWTHGFPDSHPLSHWDAPKSALDPGSDPTWMGSNSVPRRKERVRQVGCWNLGDIFRSLIPNHSSRISFTDTHCSVWWGGYPNYSTTYM